MVRVHGVIDRNAAEELLRKNGMFDGSFLVREKLRSPSRIVFVLSLVSAGYFRHHLLERREGHAFTIDNGEALLLLNAFIVQLTFLLAAIQFRQPFTSYNPCDMRLPQLCWFVVCKKSRWSCVAEQVPCSDHRPSQCTPNVTHLACLFGRRIQAVFKQCAWHTVVPRPAMER